MKTTEYDPTVSHLQTGDLISYHESGLENVLEVCFLKYKLSKVTDIKSIPYSQLVKGFWFKQVLFENHETECIC